MMSGPVTLIAILLLFICLGIFRVEWTWQTLKSRLVGAAIVFVTILLLFFGWYYLIFQDSVEVCQFPSAEDANQPIPKILHHIWLSEGPGPLRPPPEKYAPKVEHCKHINANWSYMLWESQDVINFLDKHYPYLSDVYKNYPYTVMRTDLARFVALYHYGGVYLDMDIQCRVPFDKFLSNITEGVVLGRGRPFGKSASFMATRRHHPYFYSLVKNAPSSAGWYLTPYLSVVLSIGTIYVAKNYERYPCKEQIKVISAHLHNEVYLLHEHESSWHQWDGPFLIWLGTHLHLVTLLCFSGAALLAYHKFKKTNGNGNGKHSNGKLPLHYTNGHTKNGNGHKT